jgi:DNA-binding transcriptional MerR regulator
VDETSATASGRRANKPNTAFRTIGEAAEELDLPAHVLRFWESKFPQLKPLKRGGGRRYYRPEDMALLRRIRECLYQEGYTIRGVQKLLNGTDKPSAHLSPVLDSAASPTLFPPDALPETEAPAIGTAYPAAPARRAPVGRLSPEDKAALLELRRELLGAKALLQEFIGRAKRA